MPGRGTPGAPDTDALGIWAGLGDEEGEEPGGWGCGGGV
jgi:hypothetical protein